jgi:hypothetical protein
MYVSQVITGPGILTVDGFVSGPPVTAPQKYVIQPPILAASVNDYAPVGMSPATDVQVAASTPVSITGLMAATVVKEKRITNRGTVPITLEHDSSLSVVPGRMLLPLNSPLVISPGDSKQVFRDQPTGMWRVAS